MESPKIEFEAEVREIKCRKLITNDMEYSVKLVGSNPAILDLGKFNGDTLLKVIIEINE